MRPHSLLLYVLLCLALAANGVGAAMASVHGGCGQDHARSAFAEPPPPAESPCHEGIAAEASAPMHGAAHAALVDNHSVPQHDDGCDDGACDCSCISHCQVALLPPTLILRSSTCISHTDTPIYTYAVPALPHPIRPPIG